MENYEADIQGSAATGFEFRFDNSTKTYRKIDSLIDFDDIDASLINLAKYLSQFDRIIDKEFLNHIRVAPQWRKKMGLKYKPSYISSVLSTVVWLNSRKPTKIYWCGPRGYQNLELNNIIEGAQKIDFIDVSPNSSKIVAVRDSNKISFLNINTGLVRGIEFEALETKKISSLLFFHNKKAVVGTRDGDACIVYWSGTGIAYSKITDYPIVQIAYSNDAFIFNNEHSVTIAKMTKSSKRHFTSMCVSMPTELEINRLATIAPLDHYKLLINVDSDVFFLKYTIADPRGGQSFARKILGAGQLLHKASYNSFVTYGRLDLKSKDLACLKLYSTKGTIIDDLPVDLQTEPVTQKDDQSIIGRSNWIPRFMLHYVIKKKKWNIMQKEEPTYLQLAFKLMMAKAHKENNSMALNRLFEHNCFNDFNNFTQKSWKRKYKN